jgi:proline racemase
MFTAVDTHTEGMPTRIITSGIGTIPGRTMLERKLMLEGDLGSLRMLLTAEPRGHAAMFGGVLQPPIHPDADWGLLFIHVSGSLPMCGHGTIGAATALVETGMVAVREPTTIVRFDTPAGLIAAEVTVRDGHAESVTIGGVPSFLADRQCRIDVPKIGPVTYDLAYGGNFFAILTAASIGLEVELNVVPSLIAIGRDILRRINTDARPVHPVNPEIAVCEHVMFTGPGRNGSAARNVVIGEPGWIDRSPCGTGTSARMAQMHSRGELELGKDFVHESVLGTRFVGRLVGTTRVGPYEAVIPRITGRAWVTGLATYLLDPTDPFPAGLLIPI